MTFGINDVFETIFRSPYFFGAVIVGDPHNSVIFSISMVELINFRGKNKIGRYLKHASENDTRTLSLLNVKRITTAVGTIFMEVIIIGQGDLHRKIFCKSLCFFF